VNGRNHRGEEHTNAVRLGRKWALDGPICKLSNA
jgi:hypothetical protein